MSHWYNQEGYLYGPVQTQKGGLRDFDLRDARKVAALPSVTTILNLLAKPGLVKWQVEQGIRAAFGFSELCTNEEIEEALPIAYQDSLKYTRYTQDFGTATHWWLNKKLRAAETAEVPPMIPGAEEVADGILSWMGANGYDFTLTEHRFARTDLGYAGTVDLVGTRHGVPVLVDLKTQEPPLTPYLEHGLQLAGYDYAISDPMQPAGWVCQTCKTVNQQPSKNCRYCLNYPEVETHRERISLIANRANPGEVKAHLWVDKGSTVEATNARYDKMFLLLRDFWFLSNNYDPRIEGATDEV